MSEFLKVMTFMTVVGFTLGLIGAIGYIATVGDWHSALFVIPVVLVISWGISLVMYFWFVVLRWLVMKP